MKRKQSVEYGYRFYEELNRVFPDKSLTKIAQILGCDKKIPYDWRDGSTPGLMYLEEGRKHGVDVLYVLSGRREIRLDTTPDWDICEYEEE